MPQPTTQPATPRRWTEDTRTAFLLALRLTGGVRKAAAEIGRTCPGLLQVREARCGLCRRLGQDRRRTESGAAAGAAAAGRGCALPAAGAEPGVLAGIMAKRTRWDGVTPVKRRAFLRVLSESGGVDAACQRVGVSDTAVYRLRSEDADFAAAWDRALATAQPVLEQVVWERAVEGWEEAVFAGGKQVGTRRRFSESLLRQLVIKREKAVALADDPKALIARAQEAARAAGGWFDTAGDARRRAMRCCGRSSTGCGGGWTGRSFGRRRRLGCLAGWGWRWATAGVRGEDAVGEVATPSDERRLCRLPLADVARVGLAGANPIPPATYPPGLQATPF